MTMTSFKKAFPLAMRIEELEKILKSLRKIEDVTLVKIGDVETSMIVINDDITCELIYKTAIALVERQIDDLKAPLKKFWVTYWTKRHKKSRSRLPSEKRHKINLPYRVYQQERMKSNGRSKEFPRYRKRRNQRTV